MAILAVVETAASIFTEGQVRPKAENKAIGNARLTQQNQQVETQQVAALNDRAREARKEQGRMQVAAGESGLQLSSGSVEAQLLDSTMQQHLANERIGINADNQRQANASEADRLYSDVHMPTVIGAGLRLVSAGVTGYASGRSNTYANQAISRKAPGAAGGGT